MSLTRSWRTALSRAMLGCVAAALCTPPARAGGADSAFQQLADRFINEYYLPANPTTATQVGVHRWDGVLEDYSRAGLLRQAAQLHDWERRLELLDPSALSPRDADDRELLLGNVRSELLTIETIQPWRKNPDWYFSGVANAAFVIMERDYAPAAERLTHLIEREQQMPGALQEARRNLHSPAAIFTRIAIEQLPGTISLFEHDLPAAFSQVNDPALVARFRRANAAVIAALRSYQHWLTSSLLPASHGDFRIGTDAFAAKLRYDEMVDVPLPRLLEIGSADLERNQREFARVARELESDRSTADVLAELGAAHPPPAELLPTFRDSFDSLVSFIQSHHIISLPEASAPVLEATPPFMRATTFAAMDTPGLLESRRDLKSYFNVTPPEPDWDARRVEDFMKEFSYPDITVTSIHEAYPGHFVQDLWLRQQHDLIRDVFPASSNAEGWAHYCEQMMIDEGFGQATPGASPQAERSARLLRLAQIKEALLRDARFVVGIRMHTGSMSLEEAVRFFEEQGYQGHEAAETETRRGTEDPTYLYYTLGKLQIQKLRADVAAREGAAFDLQRFHDDFMREGPVPVRLVRRALLHDETPVL